MTDNRNLVHVLSDLLAQQADKKWEGTNVNVQWHSDSTQISLPSNPDKMSLDAAIDTLTRIRDESMRWIEVREEIEGHHLEALYAFNQALKNLHGVAQSMNARAFIFEIPSEYVSIQTSYNHWERVPIGHFKIPGISEPVIAGFKKDRNGIPQLVIGAEVRKREEALLANIAEETRRILKEKSLYHGKALKIKHDSTGKLEYDVAPTFLNLEKASESELIFKPTTDYHIQTNILSPIRNYEQIKARGRSIKRGVLLYGNYGTGKTLITRVAAKVAVDNGFTVIVIDRASALKSALNIAERHQPCVVIVEDLDLATRERGNEQNDLLLTMDGFTTKSDFDVIVLATTNDVNSIIESLLRPGRFDDVFRVGEPDAETAKRIIRHYAGDRLAAQATLEGAATIMAGQSPASLHEVVNRADNAAIMLGREKIDDNDLERAAESILDHLSIVNKNRIPEEKTSFERELRSIVRTEVLNAMESDDEDIPVVSNGKSHPSHAR